MATVKKRMLPAGWYPGNREEALSVLQKWSRSSEDFPSSAVACVVPHAGWDFSGELAFSALRRLVRPVDTIAVVGGHLPPRRALLLSSADRFETPFGCLDSDKVFLDALRDGLEFVEDTMADNTVEIQLPLIKHLFPETRILSLRVSPTADAILLGKKLYAIASGLKRSMAVVGSTDLTHYGPAYGFSPAGTGDAAVKWVKEENDKPFLDMLLAMDGTGALEHASRCRSACSAGGAAAAAAFAEESGVRTGTLVGYRLSRDLHPAESFVGYGAIVYLP